MGQAQSLDVEGSDRAARYVPGTRTCLTLHPSISERRSGLGRLSPSRRGAAPRYGWRVWLGVCLGEATNCRELAEAADPARLADGNRISVAPGCADHDVWVAAHFRREPEGKEGQREPRPEIRPDATNSSLGIKLTDHRISELEGANGAIAHYNAGWPIPDFFAPAKPLHRAIHGAQKNSQIVVSPEHQPSGEGRDQLRIGRQRRNQLIDVVALRGRPVARYSVVHNAECSTMERVRPVRPRRSWV